MHAVFAVQAHACASQKQKQPERKLSSKKYHLVFVFPDSSNRILKPMYLTRNLNSARLSYKNSLPINLHTFIMDFNIRKRIFLPSFKSVQDYFS